MRGLGFRRRMASQVRRMMVEMRSSWSRAMAVASDTWVLTWVTTSCVETSMMVTSFDAAHFANQFGMPGKVRVGKLRGLLVHGQGDHGGDLALQRGAGRGHHVGAGGVPGLGAQLPHR